MSYDQKFVSSDNPALNIWQKVRKLSKVIQDKETLISGFAYVLIVDAKNQELIFVEETRH